MLRLLWLLLLVSCGTDRTDFFWVLTPKDNPPPREIHPDIACLIDEFQDDAEYYGVFLEHLPKLSKAGYGELPEPGLAGVCKTYSKGGRLVYSEIILAERYRDLTDTWTYKGLVYHELGHCVLLKDHVDGRSIMNPYLLSERTYEDNWDSLVDNLFDGE